jgi:hypothetical protein
MERTEVLDMMTGLKLYGMRSAYDETLATAIKRKHEPQRLVGDLLKAEISEKQARSIKYQLTVAKLPLAKDVEDFTFKDTPINEPFHSSSSCGSRHRVVEQGRRTAAPLPMRRQSRISKRHWPWRGRWLRALCNGCSDYDFRSLMAKR